MTTAHESHITELFKYWGFVAKQGFKVFESEAFSSSP